MIEAVQFFGAHCDNCKEAWFDDHNGWSAMSDESTMKNMLSEYEWHFGDGIDGEDGKHYCPSCFRFNDEDKFILNIERFNPSL